ncbi:hypothetical protein KAU11_06740, partial [Candidatus Babeliales bacterium]|nr:hypothetical protein [Candidatus Babeliales bacterium]
MNLSNRFKAETTKIGVMVSRQIKKELGAEGTGYNIVLPYDTEDIVATFWGYFEAEELPGATITVLESTAPE